MFLNHAEGKDEGGRDAGIAEFRQFLSSWLRRDTRRLGASLARFTGHPPTDMALTRAAAPCSRAGHDRETPYQRRAEEIFSASPSTMPNISVPLAPSSKITELACTSLKVLAS